MRFIVNVSKALSSSYHVANQPEMRRAILSGNIDHALEVTNSHFPTVLAENPDILFHLKCRKWVELISKTTELSKKQDAQEGRRTNSSHEKAPAEDDFAQDMELDDHNDGTRQSNASDKAPATDSVVQYDQLINEAMLYGQELQREYRDEGGEYAKTLQDIFSLVAYDHPKDSVHGHLLDTSGRVTVAEELNSAILGLLLTIIVFGS